MEDRENLLKRIVKGAEFIESLPKGDKRLPAAWRKYDSLCEDLLKIDGRSLV